MKVIETPCLGGFSPEKLTDAIEIASEQELNALVLRGMAEATHDQLVELRAMFEDVGGKFYEGSIPFERLNDLGWDLSGFDNQTPEYPIWPTATETGTTIELTEIGKGIDWHTDLMRDRDYPNVITIPYGYGLSINLMNFCVFSVAENCRPYTIKKDTLTIEDVDELAAEAIKIDKECDRYVAQLAPGDVIIWKQPAPHTSSVHETRFDELRRAIVLVKEDTFVVSAD